MWNAFEPNVKTTIALLRLLRVKVNPFTVNETLQNHPDWPSLLCISDSLSKWHIPNAAGKVDKNDIDQLPVPFLACIISEATPLSIVTKVTDTDIYSYQSNYTKLKKETRDKFLSKWDGVYLIAESSEHSGESDYKINRRKSLFQTLIPSATIVLLLFVSLLLFVTKVAAIKALSSFSAANIYLQYFIVLAGIAVASLLLWYEIDRNSPVLKKFCTGIAKSDCNAVLTSKYAKMFSWLSWSEVGFLYFVGGLLTLIFSEDFVSSIIIIGWLNILAAPYILFSIYYQARIVKQWCPLCLTVQSLLFVGTINAILGDFLKPIPVNTIPQNLFIVFYYLIPALAWFSIKPYILRLQNEKNARREHLRIKFNAEIFDTLLKKQAKIVHSTDGIGLILGNKSATNELVKVCNPYCWPCSKAHSEIEKLIEQVGNIKVRIIFTATTNEEDLKYLPVKHLLAIASKNDETLTKKALDDWYLADKKDYNSFATKYPMNGELKQQNDKIEAMNNWCKLMNIHATPTIFINRHLMPKAYNLEDLNYFLSE
jgi:uncharacterized membrane protein